MIPVEGHIHLFRDETTGAIINMSPEYQVYMKNKKAREEKTSELENLKSDMANMKDMLSKILEKLS